MVYLVALESKDHQLIPLVLTEREFLSISSQLNEQQNTQARSQYRYLEIITYELLVGLANHEALTLRNLRNLAIYNSSLASATEEVHGSNGYARKCIFNKVHLR